MFRTNKTAKRPSKKGGPITPVTASATAAATASAATASASASAAEVLIDLNTLVAAEPTTNEAVADAATAEMVATAATAAAATAATAATATAVVDKTTSESRLFALLDAESKAAVHKPWLRLERGLRMRLLRAFVERQKDLTAVEKPELLAALVDALDKKLLNSKSQITYSPEMGDIVEINALKIIGSSRKIFRIEPPNRTTKKAQRKGSESD